MTKDNSVVEIVDTLKISYKYIIHVAKEIPKSAESPCHKKIKIMAKLLN